MIEGPTSQFLCHAPAMTQLGSEPPLNHIRLSTGFRSFGTLGHPLGFLASRDLSGNVVSTELAHEGLAPLDFLVAANFVSFLESELQSTHACCAPQEMLPQVSADDVCYSLSYENSASYTSQ